MGLGKPKQESIEETGVKKLRQYEKEHLSKLEKVYLEIKDDMDQLEKHYLSGMFVSSLSFLLTRI